MSISIKIDGRVVVTTPKRVTEHMVSRFVDDHKELIAKNLARVSQRAIMRIPREDVVGLKKRARELVENRSAHFAHLYNLSYKKITVRAQKSRWGSCSAAGHLSFNYKIAVLPPHLVDYIVVHEICHLKELNHSKRFWELVGHTIPNYRALRKELGAMHILVG